MGYPRVHDRVNELTVNSNQEPTIESVRYL